MDPENPARDDAPKQDSPLTPTPEPAEQGEKAAAGAASKEHLVEQLRASIQRRRPWTVVSCLLVLLFCAVPIGLLAWWLWPRGEPPTLVVTAFDQVGVSGKMAVCRARLQPVEAARADLDLTGRAVVFQEIRFDQPNEKSLQTKAKTQANGVAEADWTVPAGLPRLLFTVRYVTPDRTSQTSDQARLFGWPRATKVLLVDVAALVRAGESIWEKDAARDLVLQTGAAEALRSAQASKFAVAYLATGASHAVTYRQVRNWLERSAAGPGAIPDGPVLGRLSVGETASAADLPKAVAAHLRQFDGPLLVLTAAGQTAEAYRATGARALVVGQGGVAWGAVAKELEK